MQSMLMSCALAIAMAGSAAGASAASGLPQQETSPPAEHSTAAPPSDQTQAEPAKGQAQGEPTKGEAQAEPAKSEAPHEPAKSEVAGEEKKSEAARQGKQGEVAGEEKKSEVTGEEKKSEAAGEEQKTVGAAEAKVPPGHGRRRRTHHKAKAPTEPTEESGPRKIVVRQGGALEPSAQIVPGVPPEEAIQQRQSAEEMLVSAEERLKVLEGRTLDSERQETVTQIRDYMEKARSALDEGDTQRGHTLALKAYWLADDLVKH